MTNIKQAIGEIENKNIINRGNRVNVKYFKDGSEKEVTGILLSIEKDEIEINGTAPKTKIKIQDISFIQKV